MQSCLVNGNLSSDIIDIGVYCEFDFRADVGAFREVFDSLFGHLADSGIQPAIKPYSVRLGRR